MNNFSCPYDSDKHIEIPTRSTKHSAGYDFKSPIDFVIPAQGVSDIIDTGIAVSLDHDKVLMCYVRSSWGFKHNITLCNGTGIIDSDFYPNSIKVKFKNDSNEDFYVKAGDKMMQGIIMKYFTADQEVEPENERTSGIGSTGK